MSISAGRPCMEAGDRAHAPLLIWLFIAAVSIVLSF
jgi:hypothetical protein